MFFTSYIFIIFFISFFVLYWFIFNKNLKLQNVLILIGSYVFYGWADWRFLVILISVSAINFYLGISLGKSKNEKYKKVLLYVGLFLGIGGLAFFKYFNFFISSFNIAFQSLSINLSLKSLSIILPLGISFYTFRILSYILDINNGKIKPTTDWVVFFTYVSFFPSVLAGPIDKARTLIPQLEKERVFDYNQITDGLRQILWGLFKKVAIAGNCVIIADKIFENYKVLSGSSLLFGAFFYTIQIYAEFSGYSDMAIGLSRLIGFNISKNFDFPFFAQNIAEFWRKWHISLTSWLTEYVFMPLSITFRAYDKLGLILAILINFIIIGIWHGANWTYILFGFLHGCYYIPLILRGTLNKRKKLEKDKLLTTFKKFILALGTFTLVMLTFIIFRSDNISQAFHYFNRLFSLSLFAFPNFLGALVDKYVALDVFLLIIFMFLIEWNGRKQEYAISSIGNKWPIAVRWGIYYAIIILVMLSAVNEGQKFIYFQF